MNGPSGNVKTPVYLDHQATTPLDPRVLDHLIRIQREHFGNASSTSHAYGWAAGSIAEEGRADVARAIGAEPGEIVFTSGATEADNLALLGTAAAWGDDGGHLVISALEHAAIREPALQLERRGWSVTRVAPCTEGLVTVDAVAAALRPDTRLVSVIAAQNEIGTIQPVADIATLCHERGVLFHTDAAQAVGHVPIDIRPAPIAMMSISAHKLYGPKGVGAIFLRRRDPRARPLARQLGGGQERGLRAGTLDVPAIAAFGLACRLACAEMADEAARLRQLRRRMWERLQADLPGILLNGAEEPRLPGNLNVSVPGLGAGELLPKLTTLAISSGSACSSGESGPSPVLLALGRDEEEARGGLRIGLGRATTPAEVDYAAAAIIAAVGESRARG